MAANALVNRNSQDWNVSQAKFECDQKKSKAKGITLLVIGTLVALTAFLAVECLVLDCFCVGPLRLNMSVVHFGLWLFAGVSFLTCGTLPFGIAYILSEKPRNQDIMSGDNANTFIAGVRDAQSYETLMNFESSVQEEPETLAKYGIMGLEEARRMRADLATHKRLNLQIRNFEKTHATEIAILSQEGTMRDSLVSNSRPVINYLGWKRDLETLNAEFGTKQAVYVAALASSRVVIE